MESMNRRRLLKTVLAGAAIAATPQLSEADDLSNNYSRLKAETYRRVHAASGGVSAGSYAPKLPPDVRSIKEVLEDNIDRKVEHLLNFKTPKYWNDVYVISRDVLDLYIQKLRERGEEPKWYYRVTPDGKSLHSYLIIDRTPHRVGG